MRISLNMKIAVATAAVAILGWVGTAGAAGPTFVLFGAWHMQRGTVAIPLLDGGNVKVKTSATATQTGSAPATLMVGNSQFVRNPLFALTIGLPTNATVVQLLTALSYDGPTPMGTNLLQAGGPAGTPRPVPTFAYCVGAGVSTACPSVAGGVGVGGWNGRVSYTAGIHQFGGVMRMGISGAGVVTNEMPTGAYPVTGGANCPLRPHGGGCPAVVNRPFGGAGVPQPPGGPFATTNQNQLLTSSVFQVTGTGPCALFGVGCVTMFDPVGLGVAPASTNTNVGFPWTTGKVMVSATKGVTSLSPDTTYTEKGKDNRTPLGSGHITLVAGGITQRHVGAVYASIDTVKMALVPVAGVTAAPSMAPLGIAAFLGLLALAGGYRLRRNKRQD